MKSSLLLNKTTTKFGQSFPVLSEIFEISGIRFLLHSSKVKSDNEIGKFYNKILDVPGGLDPIMSSVVLFVTEGARVL